jgi:hypothetical protein
MTKTKNLPQQARAAVLMKGQSTRDAVYAALASSDQPLIALEVKQKLAAHNILLDTSYVRLILNQLCETGNVRTRLETLTEREIRMNGRQENRGKHLNVHYYWAGPGRFPGRTKAAEFSGRENRNIKKNFRPARQVNRQTGTPETQTLMQRVANLEAKLAEIQKTLG